MTLAQRGRWITGIGLALLAGVYVRALAFTPVWILAAALIAGVVPAWRASRMVLADNLRNE